MSADRLRLINTALSALADAKAAVQATLDDYTDDWNKLPDEEDETPKGQEIQNNLVVLEDMIDPLSDALEMLQLLKSELPQEPSSPQEDLI